MWKDCQVVRVLSISSSLLSIGFRNTTHKCVTAMYYLEWQAKQIFQMIVSNFAYFIIESVDSISRDEPNSP